MESTQRIDSASLIYDPEQLRIELGVSRATVYKGLRAGTIPSIRLGKRYIIPRAAIQKWLESGGTPPGTKLTN